VARIKLSRFVNGFTDRHGKPRYYFRRPGFKAIPLPGLPYTTEFMDAYALALAGITAPRTDIGSDRLQPGSVAKVVAGYLASAAFNHLAPETKRTRRNILERFREQHGEKQVALLRREHIMAMVAAKAETPSASRNLLNTLRVLMQYAIELGIRSDDPTLGVKHAKIRSKGYRTWTEDDINKFEAAHPLGSRARLALALLLYTMQRRSDVVQMGWQHVRGDELTVVQQKTGTKLTLPLRPELKMVLDATPRQHLTFLTTRTGSAFTPAGFTNWFRHCCDAAGLPRGLSAHGLRKAGCRRLAEAGCSAHEIAAWSGHLSLREVERYTKAADQARLARNAMARGKQ
jgi:integrase